MSIASNILYGNNSKTGKPCSRHRRKWNIIIKMNFKEKSLKIWSELIRLMTKTNGQSLSTRQFSLYKTAEEFRR